MKHLTLILTLFFSTLMFSTSAFAKKVEKSPVMRDGLFYEPFSTNIANGQYEIYHKNGQLKEKSTYKDGKLNGPFESYHKNGQLKEKSTYKDGKANGPSEFYYENGQLKERLTKKDRERRDAIKDAVDRMLSQ